MIDPGDLLLRWVSELGEGELPDVKRGMWWLAGARCPDVEPGAPGRWLRDALSLAYLDIDWRNRRWCATPPALTRLPQARGLAVLTGSRTAAFEERLELAMQEGPVEVFRVPSVRPARDIPLPVSLLVQFDGEAELKEWAGGLGVAYTPCFALQGAALLPPVSLETRASAPEFGKPLERYDLERRAYGWVRGPQEDGLYRIKQGDGKRVCQVLRDGTWYETVHEEGVYSVLGQQQGSDADVLRWLPDKEPGCELTGTLFVDWGYPLPDLHRRVAALCSGLAPRINEHAENLAYDNVPKDVAEKIADSLGQHLTESNE
ncbi:hypothetical protein DDQ41_12320 [Streptomyces spongiicola]|uniref:PE-PGRS family protein n=1 Tax=Streptomyces spongiicola TaxID=1690221 RepID=A0ABM6V6L4_9ACTN|nr:hypothetical protein [Streptomyces spongiicola]AWK09573.1 hypothetical protein DDQ41_12320 [Streptomyces spongiicola]